MLWLHHLTFIFPQIFATSLPYPVVAICVECGFFMVIWVISLNGFHETHISLLNEIVEVEIVWPLAGMKGFGVCIIFCYFVEVKGLFYDSSLMIFNNIGFVFRWKLFLFAENFLSGIAKVFGTTFANAITFLFVFKILIKIRLILRSIIPPFHLNYLFPFWGNFLLVANIY